MYPSHIKNALQYILSKVCIKIHNAYMEQICEDIQMLKNFKTISTQPSQPFGVMFEVVDEMQEYRLFKLLTTDI